MASVPAEEGIRRKRIDHHPESWNEMKDESHVERGEEQPESMATAAKVYAPDFHLTDIKSLLPSFSPCFRQLYSKGTN